MEYNIKIEPSAAAQIHKLPNVHRKTFEWKP